MIDHLLTGYALIGLVAVNLLRVIDPVPEGQQFLVPHDIVVLQPRDQIQFIQEASQFLYECDFSRILL